MKDILVELPPGLEDLFSNNVHSTNEIRIEKSVEQLFSSIQEVTTPNEEKKAQKYENKKINKNEDKNSKITNFKNQIKDDSEVIHIMLINFYSEK